MGNPEATLGVHHTSCTGEPSGKTVEEMWEHNQGWKWDIFSPYLPQEDLKIIQSYELKEDPSVGDMV